LVYRGLEGVRLASLVLVAVGLSCSSSYSSCLLAFCGPRNTNTNNNKGEIH